MQFLLLVSRISTRRCPCPQVFTWLSLSRRLIFYHSALKETVSILAVNLRGKSKPFIRLPGGGGVQYYSLAGYWYLQAHTHTIYPLGFTRYISAGILDDLVLIRGGGGAIVNEYLRGRGIPVYLLNQGCQGLNHSYSQSS